jgi:hypothetical protein
MYASGGGEGQGSSRGLRASGGERLTESYATPDKKSLLIKTFSGGDSVICQRVVNRSNRGGDHVSGGLIGSRQQMRVGAPGRQRSPCA